ncbi:YetF domain-containing protein [Alkalicoccobacillus porphyridii]|nr:YetF domain-containing protein [Alkalicoccobacillus porphyridii]
MLIDATRVLAILGLLVWFQYIVQTKKRPLFIVFPFSLAILLVNDLIILYSLPAVVFFMCILLFLLGAIWKNLRRETRLSEKKQEEEHLLPFPVIMDGEIQYSQLEQMNQNEFWLRRKIRDLGYKDIKGISYCSIKGDQLYYIDFSDKK